jgi:hypothetical protein
VKLPGIEALKEAGPQAAWEKVLGATPVVMTVIATALAGLASSEMTTAQYDRSWGAQLQSKASDQWNYYQAKKLRGVLQGDSADLIASLAPSRAVSDSELEEAAPALRTVNGRAALAALRHPAFSVRGAEAEFSPEVRKAFRAVQAGEEERALEALAAGVKPVAIRAAMREALARVDAFATQVKPISATADAAAGELENAADPALRRAFAALRLRYASLRYDAESRLDQDVGYLYEVEVRMSNHSALRHHDRSQRFFLGMLAAQMAVILATFALATKQRSWLWGVAAAAGLAAVAFAVYVYLMF